MRFFFDNNLPPRLAKALQALESNHQIRHLQDMFEPDAVDVHWMGKLAVEGDWIVVSMDTRILRNPQNRAAWKESKLMAFFLKGSWATQTLWDQAWRLIQWWPTITKTAESVRLKPGQGYWVPLKKGKLELID